MFKKTNIKNKTVPFEIKCGQNLGGKGTCLSLLVTTLISCKLVLRIPLTVRDHTELLLSQVAHSDTETCSIASQGSSSLCIKVQGPKAGGQLVQVEADTNTQTFKTQTQFRTNSTTEFLLHALQFVGTELNLP